MTMKGIKHTAEGKARISEAAKQVWAQRKAEAEHSAINSTVPRCKRSPLQTFIAFLMGGK
ncbi:hypothetical protein [Agrobacterium vaccinii]|uniref:hypothetical protein n=1 Tax=Agrobacterium vaccinii TaxID=2735528 RepID=UPI001E4F0258|nr:hypothetical protein [Agrobacterium vaccinii]UHS56016.1 hypothetical protein HRS00_03910 [Agrobacterium vaccinii]